MDLKLVYPCEEYMQSYKEAYAEDEKYRKVEEEFFCPPDIVIEQADNYRLGRNMKEGYVQSSMLWLVDGKEFIGAVDIRHELTENLLAFGGHIGYEIRYSMWNKGYCTKMLELALQYAKDVLHLDKVLLTCYDDNIASARVMEKNGAVLENVTDHVDEKGEKRLLRRYWIEID